MFSFIRVQIVQLLMCLICGALCVQSPTNLLAQTKSDQPAAEESILPKALYDINKPLLVLAFNSSNDLFANLQGMLKRVGREDLLEKVTPKNLFAGDSLMFEYMTQDKPFGMVMYWDPAKANFIPNFCFYLPTDQHAELMDELQWGVFRENKGKPDGKPVFELTQDKDNTNLFVNNQDPDNGMCMLKRDDYLLMSNSEDLLRNVPPQFSAVSTGILRNYAAGVELNPNGLPKLVRMTFLTYLKATAEGQLQQRDEESNAQFELRQTMQRRDLERLEMLINEAEYARIGVSIAPDSAEASISGELKGMPGTQLMKDIKKGFSRNDIYSSVYKEDAIFSLNMSTIMAEKDMEQGRIVVKKVENVYKEYLGAESMTPGVQTFFSALDDLFTQDELNAFLRFDEVEENEFALIAGFSVPSAKELNSGLQEMLTNLQLPLAEERNIKVQTNADDHQGITFHKLEIPGLSSEDAKKFLGTESALYVGAGQKTMWFCLGGTSGMRSLKTTIDDILAASGKRPGNADIKLNLHLLKLGTMPGARTPTQAREAMSQWMTEDNDRISAVLKPKEDSVFVETEVAEGVLKLMGNGYAKSLENRDKRREEMKKRIEERKKRIEQNPPKK